MGEGVGVSVGESLGCSLRSGAESVRTSSLQNSESARDSGTEKKSKSSDWWGCSTSKEGGGGGEQLLEDGVLG
jgi:hypothetical protein